MKTNNPLLRPRLSFPLKTLVFPEVSSSPSRSPFLPFSLILLSLLLQFWHNFMYIGHIGASIAVVALATMGGGKEAKKDKPVKEVKAE